MNLSRIIRLLKLLQALQAGDVQNADALADACEVSRRTIFRDIETLRAAGVPLEFDRKADRYSISSSFFLPPTNFTAEEALSLIALAGQMGSHKGLPLYEPARRAVLKLESSLPGPLREELQSLTRAIQINIDPTNPLEGKNVVYQQLVQSIASRRVAKIRYASLTELETIETKLRPYQLLFSRRSWHVVGRSTLHAEIRIFNLSRITRIELLTQKYSVARRFNLESYLGNAWNLIPERGPDSNVVVRFQPMVAKNVSEVLWHKTQSLKFLKDGCLEFSVCVSGLSEIAWWILGYGDQAEVLKPAKLRKIIAHRVANMHELYRGG